MDEYMGSARCIHVDTECGRVVMRAAPGGRRAIGDPIRLGLDPAHICLFDASTGQGI
jgi:hypothetical protein